MKNTPVSLDSPTYCGQKFGSITLIRFTGRDHKSKAIWLARCDCGREFSVRISSCLSGNTRTCGCSWKLAPGPLKHGMSGTRVYKIWKDMRKRCHNPNTNHAKYYVGRGISVCEEWDDFEAFFADMGHPPPGTSLDRIDNNKGYSKENCRWATAIEQANNTSVNRLVSAFGKTQTLAEWARQTGIHYSALLARLDNGWEPERALTAPRRINQYV